MIRGIARVGLVVARLLVTTGYFSGPERTRLSQLSREFSTRKVVVSSSATGQGLFCPYREALPLAGV